MKQEPCKNAEKNFKTNAKNLLEELQPILTDFFVCELTETENTLFIRLENGQVFSLILKEVT